MSYIQMTFNLCPLCGRRLSARMIDGHRRHNCPGCGFIHYRNPVPAAGCIIVIGGRLLLVKRRYQPYQGRWCLPAGFMEYGESPQHCARREILEETGLKIKLGRLVGVYSGSDDPRTHAVLIVYQGLAQNAKYKAGDDASDIRLFPFDKLPEPLAFRAHLTAIKDFLRHERTTGK
jgi:ADP-ribose pyrophosphatase YjhB (NUDIX family)